MLRLQQRIISSKRDGGQRGGAYRKIWVGEEEGSVAMATDDLLIQTSRIYDGISHTLVLSDSSSKNQES